MAARHRMVRAVIVLNGKFRRLLGRLAIGKLNKVHSRVLRVLRSLSGVVRLARVRAVDVRSQLRGLAVAILADRHQRDGHVLPFLGARHIWVPLEDQRSTRTRGRRSKGLDTGLLLVNRSSSSQHTSGSHKSGKYKVLHGDSEWAERAKSVRDQGR